MNCGMFKSNVLFWIYFLLLFTDQDCEEYGNILAINSDTKSKIQLDSFKDSTHVCGDHRAYFNNMRTKFLFYNFIDHHWEISSTIPLCALKRLKHKVFVPALYMQNLTSMCYMYLYVIVFSDSYSRQGM